MRIKDHDVLRIDERASEHAFLRGGLAGIPSNLLLHVIRSRLAQLLICTVLIMTGTTRRNFRKGKALLLKVGSVIPISHDSQN